MGIPRSNSCWWLSVLTVSSVANRFAFQILGNAPFDTYTMEVTGQLMRNERQFEIINLPWTDVQIYYCINET